MTRFVALDFETSDYKAYSACSIGLVLVEDNKIVKELVRLIRPPEEKMVFTHIHGLTWEDVAGAPTFKELWPEFLEFFKDVEFVAAHNASFDKGVLKACCDYYGLDFPELHFQCTVQMARKVFKIYPTKLSNVCSVLGIELKHHEALSDARACAQIVIQSSLKESSYEDLQHSDQ